MLQPLYPRNEYYLALANTFFEAKLTRLRSRPNARGRGQNFGLEETDFEVLTSLLKQHVFKPNFP